MIKFVRYSQSSLLRITERMLYWADGKLGRVERCRLDGSDRQLLYLHRGDHYNGMALSPRFIYVTDQTKRYTALQTVCLSRTDVAEGGIALYFNGAMYCIIQAWGLITRKSYDYLTM